MKTCRRTLATVGHHVRTLCKLLDTLDEVAARFPQCLKAGVFLLFLQKQLKGRRQVGGDLRHVASLEMYSR